MVVDTYSGYLVAHPSTPDAAGLDLYALQQYQLNARDICIIDTGIGIQNPPENFRFVAPRSSHVIKGIQILGGIIDSDYQGENKVILLNNGTQDLLIQPQDRVAQILILPLIKAKVIKGQARQLTTVRGDKGFGSTNTFNNGAKIWVNGCLFMQ
uniref:Deoxyuridine 5'-triphosphate nucleotidohydrolase n=1 Tax=Falco tinnunculus TaxID=100819 RepID=A0A8C4V3E6_FALTI